MVSVLSSDVRNRYNPVNFEGHEVRMTIVGDSVLVTKVEFGPNSPLVRVNPTPEKV